MEHQLSTADTMLRCIVNFIQEEVGLKIINKKIKKSFLPGIRLTMGSIEIDPDNIRYTGDLLHEAGHLAVLPRALRNSFIDEVKGSEGFLKQQEVMAILWSYAAAAHLQIDPRLIFHDEGYRGASDWWLDNFSNNIYPGVEALECFGLTYGPEKAKQLAMPSYPVMIKWLRD